MDDRYGDDSRTLGPDIDALQQGGSNPEKSQDEVIKQLLNVMYHHKDREAAIAAARAAVMSLYQDQGNTEREESLAETPIKSASDPGVPMRWALSEELTDVPSSRAASKDTASAPSLSIERDASAPRSAPAFVLSNFPGCKRLEDAYRKIYHIPNKTPLSVCYEYASRRNLQLVFEEMQESAGPGPFMIQTTLRDADGNALYRPGVGTACAKKDAKQLAAATLLEHLLESVPFQDLLYKSDKQQQLKDLQESRMRWPPAGKGRCAPGRPIGRPGPAPGPRLPPLFGAGAPNQAAMCGLPGHGQVSLPYGLLPGLYDGHHAAQHNMRGGNMPGPNSHYQQPGARPGGVPSSLSAAEQASAYLGNRPLQGGDAQYSCPADSFSMHRNDELTNGYLGYDLGSSMGLLGGGGGNAAMLEAGMAALEEQQQQQQQLGDVRGSALLQQDFAQPDYGLQQGVGQGVYSRSVYLDPQLPGRSSALENLLRWPDGPTGQF